MKAVTCTHGAVGLSVPLDDETGAVPNDHPLQVRRHVGEPGQDKNRVITRDNSRRVLYTASYFWILDTLKFRFSIHRADDTQIISSISIEQIKTLAFASNL